MNRVRVEATLSQDQILFGLGLVLVLAVGSQLVARLVRVPALVVLLPAGFLAGIATDHIHPDVLLGPLYQPFVSIAVGVILFEAGLRLSFGEVIPGVRNAVVRLVTGGALVTWLATTAILALLFDDMDRGVALLTGAILVVSGPTVVLPLLAFIRPKPTVRSLLKWEATLVQLLIGVLFVLVAASVSPAEVRSVLPEALVLVAVMVLLIRPAAAALGTVRSSFTMRERGFVAWMAPRGIVAGATASAFGPELARNGIAGAGKVLPIVFVAIFGTVVVYGLTATPVARVLGVAAPSRTLVLIVSGHSWAREIASALKRSGVDVRMWVGPTDRQAAARDAGLDAERGRIMVDALNREAELEEVTDALLLARSDDFNTLGAAELRNELGDRHVFRLAPDPDEPDLMPPSREAGVLGNRSLTFAELDRRFAAGARLVTSNADVSQGSVPLFAVAHDGRIRIAADGRPLNVRAGDTVIALARDGE